jgi:iron complex transport system substrate-binding protein
LVGSKARLLLAAIAFGLGVAAAAGLVRVRPARTGPGEARRASRQGQFRYGRIITMSPAVTEVAFALGAGERIVGVSQHTRYPPAALERPACGGYYNPNYEQILSLRPDLMIAHGRADKLRRFARDNGIDLLTVDLRALETLFEDVRRIGRALQLEPEAALLCAEMEHRLARVRARVARREPVRVLLVVGREPGALADVMTAGPRTFLNDLVKAAGGANIFGDLRSDYPVVSKEAIVARAPEVIVELRGRGEEDEETVRRVEHLWRGLPTVPAVRQGRVHVVEATYAMIPGPRIVKLAERLADVFHPEVR